MQAEELMFSTEMGRSLSSCQTPSVDSVGKLAGGEDASSPPCISTLTADV